MIYVIIIAFLGLNGKCLFGQSSPVMRSEERWPYSLGSEVVDFSKIIFMKQLLSCIYLFTSSYKFVLQDDEPSAKKKKQVSNSVRKFWNEHWFYGRRHGPVVSASDLQCGNPESQVPLLPLAGFDSQASQVQVLGHSYMDATWF